jgi:threonine/homoserine/homoserine lactone efflux protein
MVTSLLKIFELGLGAISPTMIGMVVLFLSQDRGLVKAIAFVFGKYVLYVLWGLVSLYLAEYISSIIPGGASSISGGIFLIFGLLLLILAVRNFFGEDDPDAPPSKLLTLLDKVGPVKSFGLGIGLSLIQPRFILLVLTGAVLIAEAKLSTTQNILFVCVLALLMIWPLLIPIALFLALGEQHDATIKSMKIWLTRHQRQVNVVVMGGFGILMLILGLTSIF